MEWTRDPVSFSKFNQTAYLMKPSVPRLVRRSFLVRFHQLHCLVEQVLGLFPLTEFAGSADKSVQAVKECFEILQADRCGRRNAEALDSVVLG
jgi:hypothetical protein